MANTTISPNMNLPVPNPGTDPGPDWANNLSACFGPNGGGIDGHNHTAGNGVAIPPAGININSDFPFNANNATLLRSVRFSAQSTPISGVTDLGCVYVSGVDLYYNDVSGNQVRITQGGGVAGSPGSISGLASPASASYVSADQTFVWQSDANTPANMDGGSVLLRNISASSKALTLNPPAAMASNFSLTLPSIPGATSFTTLDASGNFGNGPAVTAGLTTTNLSATAGILRTQMAAVGQQISAEVNFSTSSASPVTVTSLTVSLTTHGRPIVLGFTGVAGGSYLRVNGNSGNPNATIVINDGSADIYNFLLECGVGAGGIMAIPPSSVLLFYVPAAGAYVYTVKAQTTGAESIEFTGVKMFAYEL